MAGDKDQRGGGISSFRVGFGPPPPAEETPGEIFRILVVAEFAPAPEFAASPPPPRPMAITAATFDEVMTALDPRLIVEVPDPSALGKHLRVRLAFPRLRSFRPEVLVQEVEAFHTLREAPPPSPATPETQAAPATSGSLLDDILSDMAGGGSSAASKPATPGKQGPGNQGQRAGLLRGILGHPDVRRLERAWRGLKLLVDRVARPGVKVEIVSAGIDEVDAAIARSTKSGESPIDLIVVDYELGREARDLERAARWASAAAAIPAPLLTNAKPEVLGFDDLPQLAKTQRRVRSVEDPRAVAFRSLTERDETRWLLLAMNGVVLRHAYTTETARLRDTPFEENAPLEGGAAWVVAVAAGSAFLGCGWACALTESPYRAVPDLHVHMVDDRGGSVSIATECVVPSEVASEAALAGITVVTPVRDHDVAAVPFATMVYRGPFGPEGVRPAADLTLADQLFVARVVPLITELAAAIPRSTDSGTARDTVRIALRAVLSGDGTRVPDADARLVGEAGTLEVTLRPNGFHGVRASEITLSAPLG